MGFILTKETNLWVNPQKNFWIRLTEVGKLSLGMGDMTLWAGASDSTGRKEGAKQGHSSLSLASCQLMQSDQLPQIPVTRSLDLDFTHEP